VIDFVKCRTDGCTTLLLKDRAERQGGICQECHRRPRRPKIEPPGATGFERHMAKVLRESAGVSTRRDES
jgi:hypothetical protein